MVTEGSKSLMMSTSKLVLILIVLDYGHWAPCNIMKQVIEIKS